MKSVRISMSLYMHMWARGCDIRSPKEVLEERRRRISAG
jgi:hypothetical protein